MAEERKARSREISDGLLRQRRNSMLISVVIGLFYVSGAKIQKINVLGTHIELSSPQVIQYLLVVLFLYFTLRYWQYYKEENYVRDMHRTIHKYTRNLEISYLTEKAREKAGFVKSTRFHVSFTDPVYNQWGGHPVAIPKLKDQMTFLFMRKCKFYISSANEQGQTQSPFIEEFNEDKKLLSDWDTIKSGEYRSLRTYYGNSLTYSIFRFKFYRLKGWVSYMFNESCFTDYQLPFLVAALSACTSAYKYFI
ncbi:hypothetical protein NB557_14690 [Vibrio alginolyticus]|uniref:hypothetical protein n=1 Tax=Vibrio diabolicus TaxID=50719 RepID=UPI00062BF555|nr:hypothetical protein [Vibrio diabolicus]MCR9674483.1 hypothetical protein [Vibrio alginolyticus]MCS0301247.1 hypothetical protein [Vibrio diabolicus]